VKMVISFISGIVVCGLILFGVNSLLPTRAETDDSSETSDNLTGSLLDIMPDIEMIYREALTMPFREAESKIYDEDIAAFYKELLERTVLYDPATGEE